MNKSKKKADMETDYCIDCRSCKTEATAKGGVAFRCAQNGKPLSKGRLWKKPCRHFSPY